MDHVALKLRRFLERADLRVMSMARSGGGHYKATVANPDGLQRMVVLPASPSDFRWERNLLAQIRRTFREVERQA